MPRFILPVSDFGKHLLNAARDSNYCLTFLLSGQSVEKSAKIKWRNKQFLSSAPCSPLTAAVVLPHPLVGGPPQPDPPRHTLQKLPKGSPLFSLLPPCKPPPFLHSWPWSPPSVDLKTRKTNNRIHLKQIEDVMAGAVIDNGTAAILRSGVRNQSSTMTMTGSKII